MRSTQDPFQTAIRVLKAFCGKAEPEPSDLDYLQSYAPSPAERQPDELARDAIRRVRAELFASAVVHP